ncbi:MAG: hypothetical protein ABEJ58_10215 [Halodesulfurarchaeum sp.]
MATTESTAARAHDTGTIATRLDAADFVHVLARKDGDALAATALVGRALDDRGVPNQVTFADSPRNVTERTRTEGTVLGIGFESTDISLPSGTSLSRAAANLVTSLDAERDPVLALAGALSVGASEQELLEAAESDGLAKSPGIGIPVEDLSVGLAYTGLFHAEFSGDKDAAASFLDDLGIPTAAEKTINDEDMQRLASAVSVAASDRPAPDRAVEALTDAIGPLVPGGPVRTVPGYADVIGALSRNDPSFGYRFLLGHETRSNAVERWKRHTGHVHDALHGGTIEAEGDLAVLTVERADPWSVARLGRDFCVKESAILVLEEETAANTPRTIALGSVDRDARKWLETAVGPEAVTGRDDLATGVLDAGESDLVKAIREGA